MIICIKAQGNTLTTQPKFFVFEFSLGLHTTRYLWRTRCNPRQNSKTLKHKPYDVVSPIPRGRRMFPMCLSIELACIMFRWGYIWRPDKTRVVLITDGYHIATIMRSYMMKWSSHIWIDFAYSWCQNINVCGTHVRCPLMGPIEFVEVVVLLWYLIHKVRDPRFGYVYICAHTHKHTHYVLMTKHIVSITPMRIRLYSQYIAIFGMTQEYK